MNLVDLLRENQTQFGTYTSLVYEGREYTNVQCDHLSSQMAHVLRDIGVQKGDRIIVCMPNRPEVLWAYTAAAKLGAIVVPTMPLLQASEIRFIALDSEPKAIITANMMVSKIQEATSDLDPKPTVLSVDAEGEEGITARMKAQPVTAPEVEVGDDDIGVILYTSGTTGRPKGVELTHANLYSNAKASAELAAGFNYDGYDRTGLVILPLSHAFGLTMSNTSLLLGQRDILLPYFDPTMVLQSIEKYRVTHFTAVPTMFHALNAHPDVEKYDLSSLALCISGSAALPADLAEAFQKRFDCIVYEGYGLSEAAPIVTAPRFDRPVKPGSVGLPLPGVEVAVVNEQGQQVPVGEVGELVVRGPNVTKGYHNLPEESAKVLKNGWLHTGDMARIDDEGYVFIVDRKKDLIIRGGFNIYPRDLEELLITHPAVSEVGVVGVPSVTMGEEVVAFIVKRPKVDISEEELIAFCQERLAKYKTPRYIQFVGFLPKNMIGKVDKKKLREMAKELYPAS